MFKKTIIPLDETPGSEAVLAATAALLSASNGQAVLLNVLGEDAISSDRVDVSSDMPPEGERRHYVGPSVHASPPVTPRSGRTGTDISRKASVGGDRVRQDALTEAVKRLEKVAAKLRESGVSASVRVGYGEPADAVLRTAREEDADSIAMTTHRQSAVARVFTGSVTNEVVRESRVPVLTMHAPEDFGEFERGSAPTTVVVPLDGSELGELAVEPALEIAKKTNARAVFIQSLASPASVAARAQTAPEITAGVPGSGEQEIARTAGAYLERFVDAAESMGIEAASTIDYGPADQMVIAIVNSNAPAMVVMSSHGRSGLTRTILGSTADSVVRNSEVPVLVIKGTDEDC